VGSNVLNDQEVDQGVELQCAQFFRPPIIGGWTQMESSLEAAPGASDNEKNRLIWNQRTDYFETRPMSSDADTPIDLQMRKKTFTVGDFRSRSTSLKYSRVI
jgi:hypothetical protein